MARARVRAAAQLIACDVHPLQNLGVLARLGALGVARTRSPGGRAGGLDGLSALLPTDGPFCFGDQATLMDLCLVLQLFKPGASDELRWPRLFAIEEACDTFDAFRHAAPERQPDAEA